jgi:RNA polymerase sigma factor FliA
MAKADKSTQEMKAEPTEGRRSPNRPVEAEMKAEPTAGTRSRSRPDTEAGKHSVDESAAEIAELWQQYKERSTAEARERLILHYSPLVKFVAGRVAAGLPQNIEQSDLVSYGIFGLIDAIDKFDPGRGYKFETYAISRIKGAIIDELRSIDWVPRSVRAKARSIERAYSKLENELRRSPEDREVAKELGMTEDELASVLGQISFVGVVALDELLSAGSERGSGATVGDTIAGGGHDPVEAFESEEMRQVLADAINRMPDRERLVLTLYYYEGLTLAEIGNVLGVTESRVCQIHTKAIFQLRSRLSEPLPERGIVT